jgi:hypothetical protein
MLLRPVAPDSSHDDLAAEMGSSPAAHPDKIRFSRLAQRPVSEQKKARRMSFMPGQAQINPQG